MLTMDTSLSRDPATWSAEQFEAYLLIYASYADLEFTDDEKDAVIEQVGFETFQEVYAFFLSLGEYEKLNFIVSCKPLFFETENKKKQLLYLLNEHFKKDGEISKLEVNTLDFLDRLL
jgi:hypothetical protein